MRCGFPFQDWDGALVRCEGGEDLQVRPDHTFVLIMNNVSGILCHNLQTCQYCFMFVKNVDGVPSASASFARRPQSTIYLKTINCGGRQNLINKCHRWKEWKYVQSELAFAQQFDFYHTGRLYESVKMGQSFKIQLEDTQKGPHWSVAVHSRVFRKRVKAKDFNGHPPEPSGQSYNWSPNS